jgi:hypothetical protein
MQGTLKLRAALLAAPMPGAFRAWLRAPLDLKQGDEIEVDLPHDDAGTIRAIGRILSLALHADGRIWYEFVAESTVALGSGEEQRPGTESGISAT